MLPSAESLPERGRTRLAGFTCGRSCCLKDAGYGWRGLSSAEEFAEAGGERRDSRIVIGGGLRVGGVAAVALSLQNPVQFLFVAAGNRQLFAEYDDFGWLRAGAAFGVEDL